MSMNEFLAQYYGTNGAVSNAESEKTAAAAEAAEQEKVAMFAKLAKQNGIDLSQYTDEQLDEMYTSTFKTAGELPPQFAKKEDKKEDKGDEKKEEEEKKAAAAVEESRLEKQAQEADYMGRIMAHAYVNEMRKIASAAEQTTTQAPEKTASIRERLLKLAGEDKPEEKKEEKKDGDKDKGDKPLPPWMKDKEASAALDNQAVEQAFNLLQEYNKTAGDNAFDVKVAAERLSAVHTLGLSSQEKVASVQNAEQASYVRALEYLEAAGYPVNWGG